MNINPFIFRAYDIRGIYEKDLTKEVVQKIGFVLGKDKESFLVGKDIRESGNVLVPALIQGLQLAGAKVIYSGTNSFGQCFFSGQALSVDKTLFVTASHLPSEWNGIKIFFGNGEPFPKEMIEKLRDEVIKIQEEELEFKEVKVQEVNFKDKYIEDIFKKFPLINKKPFKIVLDCGNGSVSLVGPDIFKKFGFEVVELFCDPDSRFPNRTSEPTPDATKILRARVIKEKADFGVAFDGDGDRGIIIDGKGRYLTGNEIGTIIGKNLLSSSKNKKIITTVACSMTAKEELESLGAEIIETPVGHTFVIATCKKENAILGIEEAGHIVMPEYFLFDDAMLIPLKIAEIIIKEGKKLSEIVDQIKIYPFEEIVFECPDEIKFDLVKELAEEFKEKYEKVDTLDGAKVYFDYGWILIRVSNNAPKIRLYVEGKTEKKLESLKEEFSKILKAKICKR